MKWKSVCIVNYEGANYLMSLWNEEKYMFREILMVPTRGSCSLPTLTIVCIYTCIGARIANVVCSRRCSSTRSVQQCHPISTQVLGQHCRLSTVYDLLSLLYMDCMLTRKYAVMSGARKPFIYHHRSYESRATKCYPF